LDSDTITTNEYTQLLINYYEEFFPDEIRIKLGEKEN